MPSFFFRAKRDFFDIRFNRNFDLSGATYNATLRDPVHSSGTGAESAVDFPASLALEPNYARRQKLRTTTRSKGASTSGSSFSVTVFRSWQSHAHWTEIDFRVSFLLATLPRTEAAVKTASTSGSYGKGNGP
jgi:hypothetical protein